MKLSAPSAEKRFSPTKCLRGLERAAVLRRLHPLAEPLAHLELLELRVFYTDRPAVGRAEVVDDVAERRALRQTGDVDRREGEIEIGLRQPERLERELLARLPRRFERAQVRVEMPAHAIRVDERIDAPRGFGTGDDARRRQRVVRKIEPERRDRRVAVSVRVLGDAVPVRVGDRWRRQAHGLAGLHVTEEGAPLLVDGLRALLPLRVQILDVPGVDSELSEHLDKARTLPKM
jgi:hypothetical protein